MKIKYILFAFLALFIAQESQAQSPLSDIQDYDFKQSVSFLAENEIVGGYPDGTYKPDKAINRAEFSKIIMRAIYEDQAFSGQDINCFTDVLAGNWFTPYVCLAKEEGIIQGYEDKSFKPEQQINQAEALKIIYEAFYEPVESIGSLWYEKYLAAAEYDGMLYFSPDSPGEHVVTRGEMAYFLAWILDETGQETDQIDFELFYGEDIAIDFDFELSPEDCYEDEYYDENEKTCYLIDPSDYLAETEDDTSYFNEDFDFFNDQPLDSSSEAILAEYRVDGDSISLESDNSSNKDASHEKIWSKFSSMIPVESRSSLGRFIIFQDEESGTLAYVEPINDDLKTWAMGVNLIGLFDENGDYVNESDLNHTLIHEYAHILTLNADQVDPFIEEENCYPRYFIQEGCTKEGSFMNLFFKTFWTRDMTSLVESDEENGPIELYENQPNDFVTDYAATNPVEDMAESFTAFIMNPKPKNCDLNQKNEKICSFYEREVLLKLRKRIRNSLNN